ncbi:MAG: acyl carrier protein [Paludibacteraceae bacterium]|nr:acyl carrier protein [Paludibacteraceae bacterium]
MTKEQIIEKLNMALSEEFEIPMELITPDADIRDILKLDSLKAMQVVVILKRHFGVVVYPRHFPRFTTFQTLYDYIEEFCKK